MTCQACQIAAENPMTGHFNAFCDECSARALAQSPDFHSSLTERKRTERYSTALSAHFKDREEEGHQMVKAWVQRLKRSRVR